MPSYLALRREKSSCPSTPCGAVALLFLSDGWVPYAPDKHLGIKRGPSKI